MNTEEIKIEIVKALEKIDNPAVLELVYAILGGKIATSAERINREQYNKEIDEAMRQVKEGKWIAHEDVVKRMNKFK